VTREVVDPHSSVPVFEVWKSDRILPISKDETVFEDITLQEHPLVDPLGSDSDYTAFFNHLGIASASIGFRGHDYGVHHSLYDSIDWMNQYGDPTYEYHQALTKIWGLMMIRLASDYFLPLYPHDYAIEIARSLGHISNQQGCLTFPSISPALSELTSRSHHFNKKARKWKHKLQKKSNLTKKVKKHMRKHNNRVLYFERALTDSQGLPNRPWFKHLIYAPQLYTGLPQAFPSLLEVVEANNDPEAIVSVENRIGNALSKARKVLKGHFNDLDMGLQDDFEEDEDLEEEDDLYDDDYE
jgi:N-acetylated-alpha-linked acidic dipeptidase